MCGIFCSLSTRAHLQPSQQILDRLKCRGPDSESTLHLQAGSRSCNVTLCSTVLSLRGSHVTSQPYQDRVGQYVVCWNGEAWSIDGEPGIKDDTASIYRLLCRVLQDAGTESSRHGFNGSKQIASTLSRVAGPYAFVFLDSDRGHLYFGRDFLGRRSLCWRYTPEGDVIICSVTNGTSSPGWKEIEADGVYFIDLSQFTNTGIVGDQRAANEVSLLSLAILTPYRFSGEGSSVIPRLSLNKSIPSCPAPLNEASGAVTHLHTLLRESLALRVLNVPDPPTTGEEISQAKVAVLFSGGLDCTVLARLCHDLLPSEEPIDLLNVAFENPRIHGKLDGGTDAAYELCPDRITGRASFEELRNVCPNGLFRFVAINIPYTETLQHRETVISLMHPHNTEMDLSICCALYFAASGIGEIKDPSSDETSRYETPARVLLSGLGADELFGGYTRHGTAFKRGDFPGLIDELELDVGRLGKRNLGRDDRVISHWGKEARFPFLDEGLLAWALNATVTEKCGFGEVVEGSDEGSFTLEPGKKVLRCLAWKLGMTKVATEKKRAIQFGARTAKMETGRTKGTTLLF